MKRSLPFLLVFLLFIVSCISTKKVTADNSNPQSVTGQTVSKSERDGSSLEKAIIIKAKSDMAGITEEYDWLKKNYPGYKTQKQALLNYNKRPYDKITITTNDGETKDIYFDISSSFGKF